MKKRIIIITILSVLSVKLFSENYWFWQKEKSFPKQNYEYYEECYISKSSGMSKEEFYEMCDEFFEEAVFDNFMNDVSNKSTKIYTSQGFYTITLASVKDDAQLVSVIFGEYGKNAEQIYRNIYTFSYDVALQDYNTKCKKYKNKLND